MSEFQKILDSFSIKETLNPKVWDNYEDPKKSKLKPKIHKGLLKIAEEFIDYLGDDIFVEDIILIGSLTNYNWSQFSDFDLHILLDFSSYGKQKELYKELFDLKKKAFNTKHDIKVVGYDVELYAQDKSDSYYSSGTYSVSDNEWKVFPKKEKTEIDMPVLEKKIKSWVDKIDSAIKDEEKDKLKTLKEKLKDYRQSGLEKEGEFSYENLVFKFLRRSGHIGKLFDELNKTIDKELSVERQITEGIEQDPNEIIKKSNFLTDLFNLVTQNREITPNDQEDSEPDPIVKKIQTALQFLGFQLPKFGVDGKFRDETKSAVQKFQKAVGLPETGEISVTDLKYLIAKLISDGFGDSKLSSIQYTKQKDSSLFSYLDLNTPEGYDLYRKICQAYINQRNPSAGISGEMMADCAKENFSQGYVPPELALAQLAGEGGLSPKPSDRPIRTNNPFNVGNTPTKTRYMPSKKDGVCAYYDLMTRNYLVGNKTADDLLVNFVNKDGYGYATEDYGDYIRSLVNTVAKVSKQITSS